MSNPIIEQITALNDFGENELGEMPEGGLAAYSAQAALGVLISNWSAAMADGQTLGSMLPSDIDQVVGRLSEFKKIVTSGLGSKMDEVHSSSPSPGR